jgi:rhamnogalacturonyl hydrolase YesR
MFTFAVADVVNLGWINPKYIPIARQGWRCLTGKISADGQLEDVCIGNNIDENISFYYNRPKELNDTHGLGALLLAATEMIKAEKKQ